MRRKISFILVSILLVFTACRTTKSIVKPTVNTVNPTLSVVSAVQKSQPQFKTANVSKMTLELTMNDRTVNVSASCKIKKDSAMFVSFQVFGFEVFKAELLKDSMRVFDKMNRHYYVSDYQYFSKRFGVDVNFQSLQSLLTAQFFCVGKNEVLSDSCKLVALTGGQYALNYDSGNMLQSTEVSVANIIQKVILKAKNSDYQLQTTYSDYTTENGGVSFPKTIALRAFNDKTKMSCDFSILKVDFNTDLKFNALGTEKYTRGDIDQIIKK